MILGIGIDAVEIARFKKWHTYSQKKLVRIFSQQEIDYCLGVPAKSAERFAVRFAAKEALFKAMSQAYPEKKFNLFHLVRHCEVIKTEAVPRMQVNWHELNLPDSKILLSCTHAEDTGIVVVLLQ
jgi:phosphopantetheine--protein transferase-like protein